MKTQRSALGSVHETGVLTPATHMIGCRKALLHSLISPTPLSGRPLAVTTTVWPSVRSVLGVTSMAAATWVVTAEALAAWGGTVEPLATCFETGEACEGAVEWPLAVAKVSGSTV